MGNHYIWTRGAKSIMKEYVCLLCGRVLKANQRIKEIGTEPNYHLMKSIIYKCPDCFGRTIRLEDLDEESTNIRTRFHRGDTSH